MKTFGIILIGLGFLICMISPYFYISKLKKDVGQANYRTDSVRIEKDSIKKSNDNLNSDVRRLLKYRMDDVIKIDSLEGVIYKLEHKNIIIYEYD